jgi:IK cytokine
VSSEYTISEDAVKDLTVEESKYLGGDMEHTHLVKGLDFALLAKVRPRSRAQGLGSRA